MSYLSPTLAVRDVKKTIEFYTKKMGFTLGNVFPDPENPQYADLAKDDLILMFLPTSELGIAEGEKLGVGVNFYLQIDGDIDEYYQELKKRKVKMTADIRDEPFGIRAFTVADPDGYLLTFNQVIEVEHEHADDGCECESCQVPQTAICQSCGMPMTDPGDFGGGDTENKYCVHCTHPDGSLKSYEEALKGMTEFMMNSRNMDREAAASAARDYMATMPAWSGR